MSTVECPVMPLTLNDVKAHIISHDLPDGVDVMINEYHHHFAKDRTGDNWPARISFSLMIHRDGKKYLLHVNSYSDEGIEGLKAKFDRWWNSAERQMSEEERNGKSAFEAYCRATGVDAEPWESLPQSSRDIWLGVANSVSA